MQRKKSEPAETWKLERDSYWVTGMSGRPVAFDAHDLIRGCERLLAESTSN